MANSEVTVKFLLPVRFVPNRGMVTKKTGKMLLEVCRFMTIYEQNNQQKHINPEAGTLFLLNGANISAVRDDTEVVWNASLEEAHDYIKQLGDEGEEDEDK